MSRPFDPHRLQFYMTIPSPCPYLPGRLERKLFTQLDPYAGPALNDYLTHAGFRRSQNVIYRPACETCTACRSLRVIAQAFRPTKSMKRTLSRNRDIKGSVCESYATQEQFDLLQLYLASRHPDGGMADMDFIRYEMMVEECAASTRVMEYRTESGELVACAIIDGMSDGFSMVYSFFNPDLAGRSLGIFMVLDQIERARRDGLTYVYLGYWVKDSPKMDYKIRFQPSEVLGPDGWALETP